MADERRFDRSDRPEKPAYKKFFPPKKKFCRFCQRNVKFIDYKNSRRPEKVRPRPGQDFAPPGDRHLRLPPAQAGRGGETGPAHGPAALRHRVSPEVP